MKKIGKTPNALTSVMICLVTFMILLMMDIMFVNEVKEYVYPITGKRNFGKMAIIIIVIYTLFTVVLCTVKSLVKKKYLLGTMIVLFTVIIVYINSWLTGEEFTIMLYSVILQIWITFTCMLPGPVWKKKKDGQKQGRNRKGGEKE